MSQMGRFVDEMRQSLSIFTLALDAMPWIACTFAELNRLNDVPWNWTIVEGAALNVGDTRWMQPQKPRLSADGTTEFLDAIAVHPRIKVIRQPQWAGKRPMCNAAVATFKERGVLMQVDADELWTCDQFRRIVEMFEDDIMLRNARFHCRFFLGPNCVTTDLGKPAEWLRVWRYEPGMTFDSHEPPILEGNHGKSITREETAARGLVFEHHSYTLPKHVAMKEALYGPKFRGALAGWHRLQANTQWPLADAGLFLPKAFSGTPCDKIF